MSHHPWSVFSLLTAVLFGCSGVDEQNQTPALGPFPERVVVTADWLNRSITVFDYARLVAGEDASTARWSTIELDAYAPGPLEVEVTPDGQTAVVAVSPGFFGGIGKVFLGPLEIAPGGSLLIVDLPTRAVRAEVKTAQVPMGIAITPDGSEAFTANFGLDDAEGNTISRIDLATGSVMEEVTVPGRPEQIALSADGSLGIAAIDGEGSIRTFDPADIVNTLSPPVVTSGDPSGVAFADGTDVAVAADSLDPLGYSTIDVKTPLAPKLIETVSLDFGIPFAASRIPKTKHVLLGGATGAPAMLVRLDCGSLPAVVLENIPLANVKGGFALGAPVDAEGQFAFVAVPGDNSLQVVDLEAKTSRSVQWLSETGPTYAAVSQP